jgi:hypothetical protein
MAPGKVAPSPALRRKTGLGPAKAGTSNDFAIPGLEIQKFASFAKYVRIKES